VRRYAKILSRNRLVYPAAVNTQSVQRNVTPEQF
jgi:hypothetical protein